MSYGPGSLEEAFFILFAALRHRYDADMNRPTANPSQEETKRCDAWETRLIDRSSVAAGRSISGEPRNA
jgi:hypothetical protein